MPQVHVRDHSCPDCLSEGVVWLIHTHSKRCQRHTGAAFSRPTCTGACQRVHKRCRSCGTLTGGGHAASLRDGLCWRGELASCWREAAARRRVLSYDAICMLCGRVAYRDMQPGPHRTCGACGGGLELRPDQDRQAAAVLA